MRRFFAILLALLVIVPLAELTLLLLLARYTDWWIALALVVSTGLLGSALVHRQGWRTLRRVRDQLGAGRVPADSIMDGAMILLAGVLLLTPGVLSDLFGISLLIPFMRRIYKDWLIGWFADRFHVRGMLSHFGSGSTDEDDDEFPRARPAGPIEGRVVDSYVVREEKR